MQRPGLFITGTDTGVGKTVVTCAIAHQLRKHLSRVGVCKPYATGCRRDREGLVSQDAEALAHWSDCRLPLSVINPIRYAPPVAPAVAAQLTGEAPDDAELHRCLSVIDGWAQAVLIEGVGGLLVPLTESATLLDLIAQVGYPVLVVARATLGTLNHTAMTVRLLEQRGLRVAGIVVNGYEADVARSSDTSMATNRQWLEIMTGARVLATLPRMDPTRVAPQRAELPGEILEAAALHYWPSTLAAAAPPAG